MLLWKILFICKCFIFFKLTQATLSIDFDEDFRDCENGKPMPGFDFSDFQIKPEQDSSITLNGTARFTKDYGHPTRWKVFSKRLERGNWVSGIVSRDIPNLCPVLQMPYEIWYPYARLLRQKTCPYKAGYEEHIDNVNIGNLATTFRVPPDFIGEWRAYHAITTTRNGKSVEECFMVPISVSEV